MSEATLQFLPWLRRGLARSLPASTAEGLPSSGGGTITVSVGVEAETVAQTVRLRGPGSVIGLASGAVSRVDPPDGTADFEANRFVSVEFSVPDLPWMFTPCSADEQHRLQPWIALIVVREQDGVALRNGSANAPQILTIDDPADARAELPDLSEAWAWAHVQVAADLSGGVGSALAAQPEAFVARLLCPRRLSEYTRYIACVVPVFAQGVAAGLGDAPDLDDISAAWSSEDATAQLPVYYSWRFSTGAEGDFESLARRLEPRVLGSDVGVRTLDVAAPGAGLPETPGAAVGFLGPLVSTSVVVPEWNSAHRATFQTALLEAVNAAAQEDREHPAPYDPSRDDPPVAPPAYGLLPSRQSQVPPADGTPAWLAEVNLDPANRSAAGLGAEAVRRNQEPLLASAWDQARSLREANAILSRTRFAAETTKRLNARFALLDDGALLQTAGSSLTRVRPTSSDTTLAATVDASLMANGVVSSAFRRVTRRGGTAGRAMGTAVKARDVTASLTRRFAENPETMLRFAGIPKPAGLQLYNVEVEEASTEIRIRGRLSAGIISSLQTSFVRPTSYTAAQPAPSLETSATALDLAAAAAALRQAMDPVSVLAARVKSLITAPDTSWAGRELPATLRAAPVFSDPAYSMLVAIGSEYMLPGGSAIADDTVGLLSVNSAFVEAFLLGANHELAREFLWREYPTDLRGTWLDTFWFDGGLGQPDIGPVGDWGADSLGSHQIGAAAGAGLVVLLKGSLLRRYRDLGVYAVKAAWQDGVRIEDKAAAAAFPVFYGWLARDTAFFGFDLSAPDARGSIVPEADPGWFFVLEQNPTTAQFGLDVGDAEHAGTTPEFWKDLSWHHQVEVAGDLEATSHARARGRMAAITLPYDDGLFSESWGSSSAGMARITLQRPVRMLIHADSMLPGIT